MAVIAPWPNTKKMKARTYLYPDGAYKSQGSMGHVQLQCGSV